MVRIFGAYVLAVLAAYAAAAVAATQSVMASLAGMGVEVGFAERIKTTAQDLVGMAPLFVPMIAVGFLIAFPVAALVLRWRPHWRTFGYPLAGGVALLAIHLLLEAALGITPIAAARSAAGLAVQAMCGVLGGWLFGRIARGRT
jgi:hypothetical protein